MASLRVSILELTLPIAAHHVGRSAYEHPQPVEDYLAIKMAAGRNAGPFDPHELGEVTIIRFGVHDTESKYWEMETDTGFVQPQRHKRE